MAERTGVGGSGGEGEYQHHLLLPLYPEEVMTSSVAEFLQVEVVAAKL